MTSLDQLTPGSSEKKSLIAGCLLFYVVFAVVAFWPAIPWNATKLPSTPFGGYGYGDPAQMTWFLAWIPYAITHGLNIFHTNYIDYPTGVNIANGSSAPLLGILGLPVTLTLGPVAAFNVLLRLAFAISAASMFFVLRTWCRWPVSFIGGFLYGFGPYMASQGQTHLNLIFVPLPPIIVWVLFDLIVVKRHRAVRMGALLGLLAALQLLIEPELLALLSVVIGFGVVCTAVVDWRIHQWRFANLVRAAPPAIAIFLLTAGYLIWSMLLEAGHLNGPALPVSVLQHLRGDLLGPIVPTINQLVLPRSLIPTAARYVAGNFSENSTYLGLPLVVLVIYFAVRWRRDRVLLTSALLSLVAFVLSLGSRLTANARLTKIPLPEALFARLPLLNNTVPVRFSFVVDLFAVIAVCVGAQHFFSSLADVEVRRIGRRIGDVTVVVLLAASILLTLPSIPMTTKAPLWPQGVDITLRVIPEGANVLTYPITTSTFTEAMSWQAADAMRFKIVGGYATVQGGSDYGLYYQPLLGEPFMQEYLSEQQYGMPYLYPAPSSTVNPVKALCAFIRKYDIGAVIYWDAGARPLNVKRMFTHALGAPSKTTKDHKILVWLTKVASCSRRTSLAPKIR